MKRESTRRLAPSPSSGNWRRRSTWLFLTKTLPGSNALARTGHTARHLLWILWILWQPFPVELPPVHSDSSVLCSTLLHVKEHLESGAAGPNPSVLSLGLSERVAWLLGTYAALLSHRLGIGFLVLQVKEGTT